MFNRDFWFSQQVLKRLSAIKYFLDKIKDTNLKRLFLVPFSETVRACSYTRDNEFKLYRMKHEDILNFNPDVFAIYFHQLKKVIDIYTTCYLPILKSAHITIDDGSFKPKPNHYDIVLTSPPYGDSKTTVAYGQFSLFANIWLGIEQARHLDAMMLGGKKGTYLYQQGYIAQTITKIAEIAPKRALEISAFYDDLDNAIRKIALSIKKKRQSHFYRRQQTSQKNPIANRSIRC